MVLVSRVLAERIKVSARQFANHIEELLYRRLRAMELLPEREFHVEIADPHRRARKHYFLDFAVFCQRRNLDLECDGDTWHARREAIPADNARDNLLQANLWHVMRFNTVQLRERTEETLDLVREAVNRFGGVKQPDLVVRRFAADGELAPGQATLDFSG